MCLYVRNACLDEDLVRQVLLLPHFIDDEVQGSARLGHAPTGPTQKLHPLPPAQTLHLYPANPILSYLISPTFSILYSKDNLVCCILTGTPEALSSHSTKPCQDRGGLAPAQGPETTGSSGTSNFSYSMGFLS